MSVYKSKYWIKLNNYFKNPYLPVNKMDRVYIKLNPIEFKIKVDVPTRADVAMSIPGMKRVDGYTVSFNAKNMEEAYKLIRIIYKYISW